MSKRLWVALAFLLVFATAGMIVHGQLVDARLENLSADPTGSTGRAYFNTTSNSAKIYNGTLWTSLGGSGTGEKTYVPTGSESSATGWFVSAASSITATTDTTAADLPSPYVTKSGLKLLPANTKTDYAYLILTQLDPADYNKKMKVQFNQSALASYTSNDISVEVHSCTSAPTGAANTAITCAGDTQLPLSTDSSSVSGLPNLTGTFRTTFDSPGGSASFLYLKFKQNSSSATHAIVVSDIVVGPGVVTQGAAVSGWTSYTPTVVGNTTSANAAQWRRVGDTMQVQGYLTASNTTTVTLTVTLPSGYTINTAALGKGGALDDVLGYGTVDSSSFTTLNVMYGNSTAVQFARTGASNVINASNTIVSGNVLDYGFTVPINEWSGAGTVNVVQNDCEYAFNTDSTTSSNTTSANAGYGPGGVVTPSGSISTGNIVKRVFWQRPRGVNDQVTLEMSSDGVDFYPMMAQDNNNGMQPFQIQNGTAYGITSQFNSATTTYSDVMLGKYMYASSTYGAAGTNWDGLRYWRLKKCAGGQAVGFGAANTTSSGLVSYEDSGTFSATFTGPRTTAAKTITYARVGKLVTLSIPSDTGVTCSAATAAFNANGSIPSALRPTGQREFLLVGIQDNATTQSTPGDVLVDSSGDLQIYKTNSGTTFTTSASCGWQATAITYTVN